MTQYNTLNVKLSNSQLNKLKSATENGAEVTLNLSSSLIGHSNDETNFPHELLLTDTEVSKIRKAFANDSLANIKFSKTHLSKMIQSGGSLPFTLNENPFITASEGFLSVLNESKNMGAKEIEDKIVDAGLSLIGNKIKNGISSFNCAGITLTNNETKYIIKVLKALENRGILLKGTTRKITSPEEGFLNFLRSLMKAGLGCTYVLIPLAKRVLLPLELSAGMSAADAAIQNKVYRSGITTLIISSKEIESIMKIAKSLEKSGLLIK